jgi:hypothetical protein
VKNSGRDGIRITGPDPVPQTLPGQTPITCNDNAVRNTTATDTQQTAVQYGLNIQVPLCTRTVVGQKHLLGKINNKGTNTQGL